MSSPSPRPRPLSAYDAKRDFTSTPEPSSQAPGDADERASRFVVHEHHARRLHWDLRLERDGVLVSWAVPNGIPTDPRHNRKAVHVEDHPLSYIDFAGTIPAGNYGAGEVTVWDHGTYVTEKWQPGKVTVVFAGQRLQGRYALFRAGSAERDWMIHRMDPPLDPDAEEMPDLIVPMRATPGRLPAEAGGETDWAYEIAWDGLRVIVHSEPGRIALRDPADPGADLAARFPELRGLNRTLGSHRAILDAEIVSLDADGRPDPGALVQRRDAHGQTAIRHLATRAPVTLMIVDLLWLDGRPLLGLPYAERRRRLDALALAGERWQVPAYHAGDGAALALAAGRLGLSKIVAKRLDGPYRPGEADWREIRAGRD